MIHFFLSGQPTILVDSPLKKKYLFLQLPSTARLNFAYWLLYVELQIANELIFSIIQNVFYKYFKTRMFLGAKLLYKRLCLSVLFIIFRFFQLTQIPFCNYLVVVFHSWKAFQVMKCYS